MGQVHMQLTAGLGNKQGIQRLVAVGGEAGGRDGFQQAKCTVGSFAHQGLGPKQSRGRLVATGLEGRKQPEQEGVEQVFQEFGDSGFDKYTFFRGGADRKKRSLLCGWWLYLLFMGRSMGRRLNGGGSVSWKLRQ